MVKLKRLAKLEAEIPKWGKIYFCDAPYNLGVNTIGRLGAEPLSLRDLAYARVALGSEHSVSRIGSWVKEGDLYTQNSEHRIILLRNSLVLRHPQKATKAHMNQIEYSPSNKELKEIIEKAHSSDDSVYILRDLSSIPVKEIGNDERTVWLFGDMAKAYGELLDGEGISEMPLWFDNEDYTQRQDRSYANQLWLREFIYRSGLDSGDRRLIFKDRVRGVLRTDESSTNLTELVQEENKNDQQLN